MLKNIIMAEQLEIKELDHVVVRFSGDSGDGMQLAGNIFSTVSASVGNGISTFPDYPADIRAPQGSLTGVSGFQVHVGEGKVYTPGDLCDVLVAMNAAALKTQYRYAKPQATIIIDTDSFGPNDLRKAAFQTDDYLGEMGIDPDRVVACPITKMVKDCLADSGMDNKAVLKCRNMFALGLVCWLFNLPMSATLRYLQRKFEKKPDVYEANAKVIRGGYNYGHNIHASVANYRIETDRYQPGIYTDVNGNKATSWGLILASEKSGRPLFLGSYPITPATDILHELAKRRDMGVKAIQMEDEIGGICAAIGASFAGHLAVTSTSGPGLALKSEALGLAVMAELPLVLVDVQRGGPSTGLPTKTEQTDLLQALYGRSGECPIVVLAAISPSDCFHMAFEAARIALEHMTPVILLTDAFIANGSSAWRIPEVGDYPDIHPNFVTKDMRGHWTPYMRNIENVRYWAIPGTEGFEHTVGGLEKDYNTGTLSNNPENHEQMVLARKHKIEQIADQIPELKVINGQMVNEQMVNKDTLLVGWGSTEGHLHAAANELGCDLAHFNYICPLPKNTREVLSQYKRIVVCELNTGQFAAYLRAHFPDLKIEQYNEIQGQPFAVERIVNFVKNS